VVAVSAVTTTLTLATSVSAATFSTVYSFLELTNFSQSPTTTLTNTETDTLVISSGGSAVAFSDALAIFDISESLVFNEIESFTGGIGLDYIGLAESNASVLGIFDIDTDEIFSFDISGALLLATSIENARVESAFAFGGLGLALVGSTTSQPPTLLDELNLLAALETPGEDNIETNLFQLLLAGNQDNIIIQSLNVDQDFGSLEEVIALNFRATYARQFNEPTQVYLLDLKTGKAGVQAVPAPSSLLGLLAYGLLGLVKRHRSHGLN
jgi:hypothetical protein